MPRRKKRIEFEFSPASATTLGLAALSGLRSMSGPAFLSRSLKRGNLEGLRGTRFEPLGNPKVSAALRLLALGEMFADKSPLAPSRTLWPALAGRALSGGLVGAALFADEGRSPVSGAALGAAAAVLAAHAGERLRATGARELEIPDAVLGYLEDRLVLFSGPRLLRRFGRSR